MYMDRQIEHASQGEQLHVLSVRVELSVHADPNQD